MPLTRCTISKNQPNRLHYYHCGNRCPVTTTSSERSRVGLYINERCLTVEKTRKTSCSRFRTTGCHGGELLVRMSMSFRLLGFINSCGGDIFLAFSTSLPHTLPLEAKPLVVNITQNRDEKYPLHLPPSVEVRRADLRPQPPDTCCDGLVKRCLTRRSMYYSWQLQMRQRKPF